MISPWLEGAAITSRLCSHAIEFPESVFPSQSLRNSGFKFEQLNTNPGLVLRGKRAVELHFEVEIHYGEFPGMTMIEIKKYDVAYYAGGKNVAGHPYRAIIGLRNESDGLIGAAYFHHNVTTMPIADTQKGSGYISCHYSAEDYPQVLDLLRNEKPVYVEFEVRAGNVANIRTSAEVVGEGEQD